MKKFIAIASAVVLFAGAAQAQDSTHRRMHDHAVKGGQKFSKELGMTEAQKAQFKTMNESFRKDAKAIHDNASLSKEQKKTQLEALRKQQHEKMQSILTTEQKEKLAAAAKNHKGKKGDFARKGENGKREMKKGGHGDPAAMKAKLGLTDAQVAKMKANQTEFKAKADAIKADAKLSNEQKKEQFKALAEQRKESMKSILTAEQLEKMKAGRKGRKEAK